MLRGGFAGMTMPDIDSDEGSTDESEEENEELLIALEKSLAKDRSGTDAVKEREKDITACTAITVVGWPLEVRLCIATFLPWTEVVTGSPLCRIWRNVELQDALWKGYFCSTWPRLAQRQSDLRLGPTAWRALFRARWASKSRNEDALEEDWLDFRAAQGPAPLTGQSISSCRSSAASAELRLALKRCREDLEEQGRQVPQEVVAEHYCTKRCRYHKLGIDAYDAFMCEASGALHECRAEAPCDFCVATTDESFLVCPVSGRCFSKPSDDCEEVPDAAAANPAQAWELELGAAHSWFEQGYSMSEDQARDYFGGEQISTVGVCVPGKRIRV